MFTFWRTLTAWILVCGLSTAACAFTFSYGNAFSVKGIEQVGGHLVLPLSNKKYRNVKLTDKKLYQFLSACQADCMYPAEQTVFTCADFRHAFTDENMIIAEVEFNKEIIVTFLVFKQPNQVRVQVPTEVVFTDKALLQQVRQELEKLFIL